jgi:hypothetical protein
MSRGEIHTGFLWENLREGDQLVDPGVDGRIRLKMDLQGVGWSMEWIDLAVNRDRWQALVHAEIKHLVPYNSGNFLTSCEPVNFSRRSK